MNTNNKASRDHWSIPEERTMQRDDTVLPCGVCLMPCRRSRPSAPAIRYRRYYSITRPSPRAITAAVRTHKGAKNLATLARMVQNARKSPQCGNGSELGTFKSPQSVPQPLCGARDRFSMRD